MFSEQVRLFSELSVDNFCHTASPESYSPPSVDRYGLGKLYGMRIKKQLFQDQKQLVRRPQAYLSRRELTTCVKVNLPRDISYNHRYDFCSISFFIWVLHHPKKA